jgi:hypothetical protein
MVADSVSFLETFSRMITQTTSNSQVEEKLVSYCKQADLQTSYAKCMKIVFLPNLYQKYSKCIVI